MRGTRRRIPLVIWPKVNEILTRYYKLTKSRRGGRAGQRQILHQASVMVHVPEAVLPKVDALLERYREAKKATTLAEAMAAFEELSA